MDVCSICDKRLYTPSLKKKRKKLYGDSSSAVRRVFERIVLETTGKDMLFENTALLCHVCDARLLCIQKLEEKLSSEKGELMSCISARCQKRMAGQMCAQPAKRARIDYSARATNKPESHNLTPQASRCELQSLSFQTSLFLVCQRAPVALSRPVCLSHVVYLHSVREPQSLSPDQCV